MGSKIFSINDNVRNFSLPLGAAGFKKVCTVIVVNRPTVRSITMLKPRYNVYVIALDKAVMDKPKFKERNPNYIKGKPCVYVGMTSKSPEERFKQHKTGYKASRYPKKFGLYLRRKLFEKLNPMTFKEAKSMEGKLARKLQGKGYGVWWN